MFDASGNRVVMQCIEECANPGEVVSFGELEDRTRASNATLVGYFKKDGEMVVAPDHNCKVEVDDVAHFLAIVDKS